MLDGADIKIEKINKDIGYESSSSGGAREGSLRKELRVINMYTIAMERWSGSDTVATAINNLQKLEAAMLRAYMLAMAINAFTAGPTLFGALYVGANVIGAAITLQNLGQ